MRDFRLRHEVADICSLLGYYAASRVKPYSCIITQASAVLSSVNKQNVTVLLIVHKMEL